MPCEWITKLVREDRKPLTPIIAKMKIHFAFIIFAFVVIKPIASFGQNHKDKLAKNAVFLEGAGQGLLYSLNYERTIFSKDIFSTTFRIGITPCVSRNHASGNGGQLFGLVNCLIGKKRIKFEVGLGIDNHFNFNSNISGKDYKKGVFNGTVGYAALPDPPYFLDITSQISFRHQISANKWFYRISFILSDELARDGWGNRTHFMLPWGGLSFGKLF
jgi:hypothetical protein